MAERSVRRDKVLQGVARREYDVVAAWSVDGLGRSLRHLLDFLGELKAKGVDLYLHQQGVDTGTPAGDALYQMLGVFAEFERAIIVQRVHAGLARARALGRRLGRPLRLIDTGLARRLLSEGESLRQVALALEVPASTLSSRLSKKP
jgi:DNA invertase Pin-like site-specific DNA recombinase